jgi:hypothetical protein
VTTWKLNIITASDPGADPRQLCIHDEKIVGIGWPVYTTRDTLTSKQYLKQARTEYTKGKSNMPSAINAIVDRMNIDDLVWTRDWQNNYFLGRVTSQWRYEKGGKWKINNIHNARDCEWHRVGEEDKVPWAIVRQFSRGTLTQLGEATERMTSFSQATYNKITESTHYKLKNLSRTDLLDYIGAEGCEDIVALYLQVKHNYYLLPSSCKATTKHIEFILIHTSGKKAVVQVKSGDVELDASKYIQKEGDEAFLLTTSGKYKNEGARNVTCLSKDVLLDFMLEHHKIQSGEMKTWLSFLSNSNK